MRARLPISIISGLIAIVINTLALKLADLISLPTAHGGLLRLISPWFAAPLKLVGISGLWLRLGGPLPSTSLFQTGFHIAVGIAMAVFYALFVEPSRRGRAISKGLAFAASVWILNAAIVIPLTGEGFAGSAHLSVAGMIWFAAAHTLFFVLLALLFQALNAPARAPARRRGKRVMQVPLPIAVRTKRHPKLVVPSLAASLDIVVGMERAPDDTSIEERLIAAAALFGFTSIFAGCVPSTNVPCTSRSRCKAGSCQQGA